MYIIRQFSTILLLLLMLFNLAGYRLLFHYAEIQSDKKVQALLDKGMYDSNDLIKIEIPLSNPYQQEQIEFEAVDGEVTLNGFIYKYVKRRISGGKLILMCLPDHNKTPLRSAQEDYFKKTNSFGQQSDDQNQKSSKYGFFKPLVSEFMQTAVMPCQTLFTGGDIHGTVENSFRLISFPHLSPEEPPEWR